MYPAFVKPVGEESSDGIAKASFAKSEEEALERMRFIHEKFHCDVLIEEYIDGRELYLSVLGNRKLTVFPPREIFFHEVPEDTPKFATFKAKWNEKYRKKWGIQNGPAKELPAGCRRTAGAAGEEGVPRAEDPRLRPNRRASHASRRSGRDRSQSQPVAGLRGRFRAIGRSTAGVPYDALIQKILDTACA